MKLFNDAIDLAFFLAQVAMILIVPILAIGFYQIGIINVSNDQKNLNRYSALIQAQHSEDVQNTKRQHINDNCTALGGTKNGVYDNCSVTLSNVEFIDLYIGIKEIDQRIQKRNESFNQWRWFGQEPIETH